MIIGAALRLAALQKYSQAVAGLVINRFLLSMYVLVIRLRLGFGIALQGELGMKSRTICESSSACRNADVPRTDEAWESYLHYVEVPDRRHWLALGGGLSICLAVSGAKTFQARIRRIGEKNARRINLGPFPAVSVADARRLLMKLKANTNQGYDAPQVANSNFAAVNTTHIP